MNNLVLHIPHSSLKLPHGFYKKCITDKEIINQFNKNITDLYTDELFENKRHRFIKAKYSKIYCDVEKFKDDSKEFMSRYGQGVIYTHTYDNILFHQHDEKYKRKNEKRTPRNKNGLTRREQQKQDRLDKIKKLLEKGFNQSNIAKELGISRQAVSKLVKMLF